MAGQEFSDEDEVITGINVTPLVDVMLVLLVIFMVTANYISQKAINLDLPKAATGESPGEVSLGLSLDKEGVLYLNGEKSDYVRLKDYISKEKAGGKTVSAMISADSATTHGLVVQLMDAVRKNGITDIAFSVEVDASSKE